KRCQETMEGWIDGEEVTQEQLFSFLYYPVQDTDPPKFSTDWDELADRDIRDISDDILSKSSAIAFAVLVDRNGYLPAHNRKYSLPLTGNPAVDLIGNRTKRIFADKTGLAAARNNEAYLLQRYSRDTGELMQDLSVPVVIKGEKWGSVRIGYRVVDE
ncbi:MAG: methyl-accepting chemotaxis protein, partial [Myxococcota bacterium]